MPTPMHVFNEIAARYGVKLDDERGVRRFFRKQILALPQEDQQKILYELLARDGEAKPSSQTSKAPQP